jgi:UDP-glucuronate decarboxylase
MNKSAFLDQDIQEILLRLRREREVFAGKSVLVTGALGFIGRYLVETFLAFNRKSGVRPCEVIAADNLISTHQSQKAALKASGHLRFIRHDVTKPLKLSKRIDFILHAAGIASPFYYRKYPLQTLEVAVTGTRRMLDLARKNQASMLFFSSSEIYGDPHPDFIPTAEDYNGNVSCLGPRSCYDEGKRVGETLCRIYHEYFGVRVKIVRPFNVYGPGMTQNDYSVNTNFAGAILDKQPVNIYGSGNQTRTFCYAVDAMVGFIKILTAGKDGQAYNVGSHGPEISMIDLVKFFEKASGRKVAFNQTRYPESYIAKEPVRRCPDLRKVLAHVGYEPLIKLEDGLGRFFGWAKHNYRFKRA